MGKDARPALASLATLAKVREVRVDEAASELAKAVAGKQAASADRRAAEAAREAHATDAARTVRDERVALERGALRAGDLATEAGWRGGAAREHESLAARVGRAKEVEAAAGDAERGARARLAARKADADAVVAVVSRVEADERRSAEARAEAAASEAWRPRQRA
jgi:hypothetical protein